MLDNRRLRICFVMLHYATDREEIDPIQYLDDTPIHLALPRELAARGHQVDIVHLYPQNHELDVDGVTYHFVASHPLVRSFARVAGRLFGRDPVFWEPALAAIKRVRALNPDVIHFHGLTLTLNLTLLLVALGRNRPPIVLHYHGGYPSRRRLMRQVQRFTFDESTRYCFTTRSHAEPFVTAGVLRQPDRVVELVETSSTFRRRDRCQARAATGMCGAPVFVWAGRLHPIKDPLTALRGFERIVASWNDAQLYLYYLTEKCLPDVRAFLADRPSLSEHVHLRGRAPFAAMEDIFNSADFFVQASRREFSGCAVLEAMACGVIPVITDIPSFRLMTGDGTMGLLFPIGDDVTLAHNVLAVQPQEISIRSAAIREHFERELSFASMARHLEELYLEVFVPARRSSAIEA